VPPGGVEFRRLNDMKAVSDNSVPQRDSASATPDRSPSHTSKNPSQTGHLSELAPPCPAEEKQHIPIGSYTDDPAANARHGADIADMMAERSRASADRAAASAATALNALRLAEVAADKAVLAADRSPHTIRGDRVTADNIASAAVIIAMATLFEIICAITIYALVRPVFAAIDTVEYFHHPAQWTVPSAGFEATPAAPLGPRP
jgi:hypothetical protein